ncbi:hypothetical protein MBLNU457_4607t1 [Dothideomycetes sp. NU457]
MKLYILGPAFGLPSIDPECNAAVALLRAQYETISWEVAISHDEDSILPRLEDGGETYFGLKSITSYLKERLPALTAQQETDQIAYSRPVLSQLLLDVSLYVSFENYRNKTRGEFTRILPWYANYVVPPRRRQAARKRTEHLGVSSIDMDTVHENVFDQPKKQEENNFEHATEQRARTLIGRRDTVRTMLKKPEYAGAFRLKSLAEAFFEPLSDLLGENDFLLGTDSPSPLDCLAYGYLSLMLYPNMPQKWLSEIMRSQHPKLVAYVERLSSKLDTKIGNKEVDGLFRTDEQAQETKNKLPWTKPEAAGFVGALSFIGRDIVKFLPSWLVPDPALRSRNTSLLQYLPWVLAATSGSIAITVYWMQLKGHWPHGEAVHIFGRRRFADFGAAGAALAALGGQLRGESAYQDMRRHEVPLEVDVEVENTA